MGVMSSDGGQLVPQITCARRGPAIMFRDARGFEWTRIVLPVPGLPAALDNFRFLHLSDLHCRSNWQRAYDDLIGLADRDGILFYSFRTETLGQAELSLEGPPVRRLVTDPEIAARYRRLLALYVSANTLLEQGRVWSWKELGNSL